MSLHKTIAEHISKATGQPATLSDTTPIGGGCINSAIKLTTREGAHYFVKTNSASLLDMFEAEHDGLAEIAATQTIRVPRPICTGTAQNTAYIVLEHIPMGSSGDPAQMGEQLAKLHRHGTAKQYGWHRDNTIGSTPQHNTWTDNWIDFYREHRLSYQIDLARKNGLTLTGANKLLHQLPAFFDTYTPQPSLLHGDLWGGNASYTQDGAPIIYDPATYYGDREAEIAFTELFGGFGRSFYQAYNHTWQLHPDYPRRKDLYNLYHILNHYNLFGGGYGTQAQQIISRLT